MYNCNGKSYLFISLLWSTCLQVHYWCTTSDNFNDDEEQFKSIKGPGLNLLFFLQKSTSKRIRITRYLSTWYLFEVLLSQTEKPLNIKFSLLWRNMTLFFPLFYKTNNLLKVTFPLNKFSFRGICFFK